MKKTLSVLLSVIILISCISVPVYANNIDKEVNICQRNTYIDKYDSDTLIEKVMDGTIAEDEFTKIDIERTRSIDEEITTVTINELKAKRIVNGEVIETFVQQTSSAIATGSRVSNEPYQSGSTSFILHFTLTYDRISYNGGYLYKITKMTGSYSDLVGRLEFKKLVLYCAASPDAYYSTTQRYGPYHETASITITKPTRGTPYNKYVSMKYYYYDGVNGAAIGGTATIYFTFSNQTTQRSFDTNITIA